MNIHTLSPHPSQRSRKRVGRGGKRGTYSGKGMKGQKSRSGASIAPLFTGGAPSLMGQGSRVIHKRRGLKNIINTKDKFRYTVVNIEAINALFEDKAVITKEALLEKKLIRKSSLKVKVLAKNTGENITKKFTFEGLVLSKTVQSVYAM
jgi:large subunit ribosomal protein L15